MADTKIVLGDFAFQNFEIPDSIPLGGAQAIVLHKLPGGARVVQSMGRDDDPIGWSGIFTGPDAIDRARTIDLMRVAGQALEFSFFGYAYAVVIRRFSYRVQRFYRVPYTLELEVVQDNTQPVAFNVAANLSAAVSADSTAAIGLGSQIGDSTLTSLLATMDSAIKGVGDFAKATQATINSVLAPVSAVVTRTNLLIGTAGNTLQTVTTVGGILPNNPIAQQAASLTQQAAVATQIPVLYNLQSVATRVQTNLNLIGGSSGPSTVTVGGGTLFDVAAKQYGDATKWDWIANANNTADPNVSGVQTLTIPDNGKSFTA